MSGIEQTGQTQMPLIHAGLIVKQKALNIDDLRQLAKDFAFAEDTAAQNRLLQDLRQALTCQVDNTTRPIGTPAPNTGSTGEPPHLLQPPPSIPSTQTPPTLS
ncbi:hypothetical protein Slin15195_G037140 [Septoria linicola]|uniref:Uncharacterized protein n=1 Tax=Septoria linicola TaxID=215465 RepID=A0A9Q9APW4_9PEZI|nr:hypothetical protein Slin15195_G037140 [Septoria linicola]